MLQHTRSRDYALFRHMTDDKDRNVLCLCDLHQNPGRFPHLRNAARSRRYTFIVHRLDRVDHNDLRLQTGDRLPDCLKIRLTQNQQILRKAAHPLCPEPDLLQ